MFKKLKERFNRLIPNPKATSVFAIKAPIHYINWWVYYLDLSRLLKAKEVTYKLRNGLKLVCRAGVFDKDAINEICVSHLYEDTTLEPLYKENSTVLDVGAHIGVFSVLYASKVKNCKIFALEPDDDNFVLLCRNVAINNCEGRITTINASIGGYTGDGVLHKVSGYSTLSSTLDIRAINSYGYSISRQNTKVFTLENILLKYDIDRVDFLKMDCEGAEYEALYSASELLDKVKKIAMEYHVERSGDVKAKQLKEFLEAGGFTVKQVARSPNAGFFYCSRKL